MLFLFRRTIARRSIARIHSDFDFRVAGLDARKVIAALLEHLGTDDERVERQPTVIPSNVPASRQSLNSALNALMLGAYGEFCMLPPVPLPSRL